DAKQAQNILQDIAFGVVGVSSKEVCNTMVETLATIFSADYALVGELIEEKCSAVRTIALRADNEFIDGVELDLVGTPFEQGIEAGSYFCITDAKNQCPSFELLGKWNINSYFGTTVYDITGKVIGVLILFSRTSFKSLSIAETMLQIFSVRVAAELERRVAEREIAKKNKMLEELAITDGLTSLYNHKHILEILAKEIIRERRYTSKLSIIMFDIDFFKKINDSYGHQVGDVVLVKVAAIIKNCIRNIDSVGRYGGEEFLVILPNSDMASTVVVAEKIRRKIHDEKWDIKEMQVTISGGIKQFEDEQVSELVNKADQFLYKAKKHGRNRIEY
ncbi:GGDEF domain-containing protein, partial [Thermodesulfobacteriota bacterium]